MNVKNLITTSVSIIFLTLSLTVSALTMQEFSDICQASQENCSHNPMLQTYIGGALDLIAVLDEETEYLVDVYCSNPSEIFDVPAITHYMLNNQEGNLDKNAMLLLIRYLEEFGGC